MHVHLDTYTFHRGPIDLRNYDSASFKNRTFQWNRNISTRYSRFKAAPVVRQRETELQNLVDVSLHSTPSEMRPSISRKRRERRSDDSSNRLFSDSCSRETGKMEKEEEKIQNRATEFCTRSPRFNDFLSLSLSLPFSPPSSSPFADLVKYLTLHGAESNCHWREFNLRDFTTALCARAFSPSNFSFQIEPLFAQHLPLRCRTRTKFFFDEIKNRIWKEFLILYL